MSNIGIDFGTTNIVMTMGKKVVVNEPSIVAYDTRNKCVVATGKEAYSMIGRTPDFIDIVRPMKDGVISNNVMAQSLLDGFINRLIRFQLLRPKIILCIPSFITEVESRAVVDLAVNTGSRNIHLIDETVSAVMGAGIDVSKSLGTLVIDIGGGTTDVAIVSLNGIVDAVSIRTASSSFDSSIIRYISTKHKLVVGELTAERLKMECANVYFPSKEENILVKGMNLYNNMPDTIRISEADIMLAIHDDILKIVNAIKLILERANPNIVDDICKHGAIMTGGGSMLKGLDKLLSKQIHVDCRVAENPLECVAKGTSIAFKNMNRLLDGFEHIKIKKM